MRFLYFSLLFFTFALPCFWFSLLFFYFSFAFSSSIILRNTKRESGFSIQIFYFSNSSKHKRQKYLQKYLQIITSRGHNRTIIKTNIKRLFNSIITSRGHNREFKKNINWTKSQIQKKYQLDIIANSRKYQMICNSGYFMRQWWSMEINGWLICLNLGNKSLHDSWNDLKIKPNDYIP